MVGGVQRRKLTTWSYSFAALGVIGAGYVLVYLALDLRPGPALAPVVACTVVGVVAAIVGIVVNKPADPLPWVLLAAACAGAAFMFANWYADLTIPTVRRTVGTIAFTLPLGAALWWLRRQGGPAARRAALDSVLVALGAASASWSAFITPVLERTGNLWDAPIVRALSLSFVAAAFMIMIHLAIAHGRSGRSYQLIAAALLVNGAVIVVYLAVLAVNDAEDARLFIAAMPLISALYAAAALHPSMALPLPGHSGAVVDPFWGRFSVICAVLAAAALASALTAPANDFDRLARLAILCLLFVAVLIRSEYAIGTSEKRQALAREQALHDDLTGLPNRAALYEDLVPVAGDRRTPCCVMFMDLNDFKLVNDSFGHRVGDELIVLVAARLVSTVGESASVYRYGGDEFVVVSWDRDDIRCEAQPGRLRMADSIVAAMREPFELSAGRVFVSTSIGIAVPKSGSVPNVDDLIREADSAMYHVKATGPGGYAMFDDGLRAIAVSELALSNALREAVERDEFELYYQPIVELATGETVAYEALLRWHLKGRLVEPGEFIGIAESSDLIVGIGEWVIDRACRQLSQWRMHRPDLRITVNVSARQLRNLDIVETVRTTLDSCGLPGDALWLELTESAFIEDRPTALAALDGLVAMGVRICIDDFGTGYSALGHLLRFPIDVVKIDKSFIRAADGDRRMFVLASAIEVLTEALELSSVAEGVETEHQLAQVKAIGCRYAQGWNYGRPMPAEDVAIGVPVAEH